MLCFLESRCDKDLDTLSGYALCLPNLTRLQTYHFAEHRPILCVEIKVKFCREPVRGREQSVQARAHVACWEGSPQEPLLFPRGCLWLLPPARPRSTASQPS